MSKRGEIEGVFLNATTNMFLVFTYKNNFEYTTRSYKEMIVKHFIQDIK